MQAEKAPSEDAAVEISADLAFDEASNGCSLLARIGEKRLKGLSHDFVEKRLLRLVALVLDSEGASPVPRECSSGSGKDLAALANVSAISTRRCCAPTCASPLGSQSHQPKAELAMGIRVH